MATAEAPMGPDDPEARKVIDKLAFFVAKNGPDFEAMTKAKQEGNPKFSFLFPGRPFFNYYQMKVATEQTILRRQASLGPSTSAPAQSPMPQALAQTMGQAGGPTGSPGPDPGLTAQIAALEDKVAQSEKNLKAQWDALLGQQEREVEAAVSKAGLDKVYSVGANAQLRLDEFQPILEALATSASKDVVARGKQWIFEHAVSDTQREVVLRFLVEKVKPSWTPVQSRLHILYVLNDWTHHVARKGLQSVLKLIQRYVAALYSFAAAQAPDQAAKDKLRKLLDIWKSNDFFPADVVRQMEQPEGTVANLRSQAMAEYANVVQEVQAKVTATYQGYQQQHQDYTRHIQGQISQLKAAQAAHVAQALASTKRKSRFDQKTPGPAPAFTVGGPPQPPPGMPPINMSAPPPGWGSGPPPGWGGQAMAGPPPFPPSGPPPPGPWAQGPPPWSSGGPPPQLPPSQPPAQSSSAPMGPDDPSLVPKVPYYELPAGLMLPLIAMEDGDYEALKPDDLRLPPPRPPSDRLLAALDTFYKAPTHEAPRDSDGWEKLGLFEYYKAKAKAVQEKRDRLRKEQERGKDGGSDGEGEVKDFTDQAVKTEPASPPRRRSRFEAA